MNKTDELVKYMLENGRDSMSECFAYKILTKAKDEAKFNIALKMHGGKSYQFSDHYSTGSIYYDDIEMISVLVN